jgi:2',3'-cyclic-nucleotide 2'-phosphodiesterase (5'-nucleotidase family)
LKLFNVGWLIGLPLLLTVAACNRSLVPDQVAPERIEIDDSLESGRTASASAEQVLRIIAPYRAELAQSMEEIIGRVPRELTKDRPESTLGNWLADLLYTEAVRYSDRPVDFAVQNQGGIRINSLPAGNMPVRTVYELMPFDNELVLMELDYTTTRSLIDHIAAEGGWPVSKHLRLRITPEGKATDITLHDRPLDPARNYVVALPDYVANGGSDSDFLVGKPHIKTDKMIRDLILLHAREAYEQGRAVTAELDGRIRQ